MNLIQAKELADFETANARLTTITSFLVGITTVMLVLSINILSGRLHDSAWWEIGAASVTIIFLLLAIMLHFSAASALVSAYYEVGLSPETAVKHARRFSVFANVLTFGALSALLLVAFDFAVWAALYAVAAVLACAGWLLIRAQNRTLEPS